MPQGERRKDIDLYDMTYDGDVIQPTSQTVPVTGSSSVGTGSGIGTVGSAEVGVVAAPVARLSSGLGQLTDGDEGQSSFRLDPRGTGSKGKRIRVWTIIVTMMSYDYRLADQCFSYRRHWCHICIDHAESSSG